MIFDWFKKPDYSNVVKFTEQIKVPSMPYVEPPTKEPETYYSIGVTSDNRINIRIGYSMLTMNEKGIRNLIEQLEVFADQLPKEEEDEQS